MFKAIIFMNFFAIFAIGNGSTFKFVHNNYAFQILDYFFLRNVSLTLVSLVLVNCLGIDVWALPESKSKSEWVKLLVMRSLAGHACFVTF